MKIRKVIDIEMISIGELIKTAREADPRSLTHLCGKIKMTRANWYNIENELPKFLPLETLRKIEKILNIDLGVNFD